MSTVVNALLAALGPDQVRTGDAIPQRNYGDEAALPPRRPLALLLPRATDDVATALRICHQFEHPVVPQGGLTGLAGGGRPGAGDIALSLERMSGIEEVDAACATLTALAGTPLAIVQEAAEHAGFALGIDLGARGSCTIGGNVATNAGGIQVLRYGMARQNVRGLEVVLADGTILRSLNKMLKNNAGYDLTQLFIGSEGTLGIITRVVLALHPPRRGLRTALCAVASFGDAIATLRALEAALPSGIVAFELMWPDYCAFAVEVAGFPVPIRSKDKILAIIEAATGDDHAARTGRFEEELAGLSACGLIHDTVVAKSLDERRRIWAAREAPAEFRRHMTGAAVFDVSLPLSHMDRAIAELRAKLAARWPAVIALFFGHLGDSNLHLIVSVPDADPHPTDDIEDLVYDLVAAHGGSISAEHGIGHLKRPYLARSRTPAEIALMRTLKAALDPKNILNPGKVLPDLVHEGSGGHVERYPDAVR